MRKVKDLTILETEEEIREFCKCKKHDFKLDPTLTVSTCINPNRQFVIGYGRTPVFVATKFYKRCQTCDFVTEATPDELTTKPKSGSMILKD